MKDQNFLPWHQANALHLGDTIAGGRLPHGLLLRGPAGLGKGLFARAVAARVLCQAPGFVVCGACRDCLLLASDTHPDFFQISLDKGKKPEEDKKQIRVEQIRDLIGHMTLTSQMQGYRVVIINPADTMNVSAQNSLLKTLEEPPENTLLMLVSSQPAGLAPTVLSRCQNVRFATPPAEVAMEWLSRQGEADWPQLLQFAWGAPLTAVTLSEAGAADKCQLLADQLTSLMAGRSDPVSVAEDWTPSRRTAETVFRLRWLQQQVYGLIQWQVLGQVSELVHKTLQRSLQKRIAALSLISIYGYLDRLQQAIGLADRPVNQTLAILPLLTVWADGPHFEPKLTEIT